MNEESKLLRAYLDEASQVVKKILVAATQKQYNYPPLVERRSCSHYKQVFSGKYSCCS